MELEGLEHSETMSEQQLREIMSRYGEDIWNYIYYLTKNAEQADDLAQEVFIKCYYRIGTYQGTSSFKAWLLTIARNTVFSHRKSRFFRSGLWGGVQSLTTIDVEKRETAIELLGAAQSAEMEYLGNQSIDEIWNLIMALSPKLREILILDLKYELTIKEIAELMSLSRRNSKIKTAPSAAQNSEQIKGVE